jgi:hypothetical protein
MRTAKELWNLFGNGNMLAMHLKVLYLILVRRIDLLDKTNRLKDCVFKNQVTLQSKKRWLSMRCLLAPCSLMAN